MALRVAELEALFTGNIDDFEAKARTVEGKQREIDQTISEAEVRADIDQAMSLLADMTSELDEIARTDTEAAVTADVEPVLRSLDDARGELDKVAREDVDVEVNVDTTGTREGLRRAEDGLGEFRDEADSTAREAAASFDGSIEGVADVLQELSANAFAGFGPAGAVAGVAAAAGLGAAITAAQDLAEENTAAAEAGAEIGPAIADGVFDAREDFRAWATEVREDNAWTFWKDEATTNIQAMADSFDQLGELGARALGAIAEADLGDMNDALAQMNDQLEQFADVEADAMEQRLQNIGSRTAATTVEVDGLTAAQKEQREALVEASEVLQEQIEKHDDARELARVLLMAEEDLTEAQADKELQLRDTNAALAEQNDLTQTALTSSLDFADGLADLTDKEDDWNASLDDNTQAGRDNLRELSNLADDIDGLGDALLDQTGSQEAANEAMRQAREDLLDQAEAAGYNRGEVEDLIDTIHDIPDEVESDIDADTSAARRKGESITDYLNRLEAEVAIDGDSRGAKGEGREARRYLNDLHADIKVSADTGNAYERARAVQRYISGLNATMDVYSRPVAGPNSGHGGPTFADGGRVEGPGTETSDSIIARLSDEEHVWTAAEVRGAGGHSEVERLRQLAKAGKLPGLADGGPVIVTGTAPAPTASSVSAMPPVSVIAPQAVTRADLMFLADRIVDALAPSMVATNRNLQLDAAIGVL